MKPQERYEHGLTSVHHFEQQHVAQYVLPELQAEAIKFSSSSQRDWLMKTLRQEGIKPARGESPHYGHIWTLLRRKMRGAFKDDADCFRFFLSIYHQVHLEKQKFDDVLTKFEERYAFNTYENRGAKTLIRKLASKMLRTIIPQQIKDSKPRIETEAPKVEVQKETDSHEVAHAIQGDLFAGTSGVVTDSKGQTILVFEEEEELVEDETRSFFTDNGR